VCHAWAGNSHSNQARDTAQAASLVLPAFVPGLEPGHEQEHAPASIDDDTSVLGYLHERRHLVDSGDLVWNMPNSDERVRLPRLRWDLRSGQVEIGVVLVPSDGVAILVLPLLKFAKIK
jgi:hypothetical protein